MSAEPSPPSQPHDAFVREVYGDPERAASLLRRQLPAAIARRIRWEALRQQPAGFVDEELRQQESDLVFRAPLRVQGGEVDVVLYVLLEHQSTPDEQMPLRLLRYVVRLMQRHVRKHGLPLPFVMPMVLYNGRRRWKVPLDVGDLVEPSLLEALPDLKAYAPRLHYVLDDLSKLDPVELANSGLEAYAAITLWALRTSLDARFIDKISLLSRLLVELTRAPRGAEAWLTILRYLSYTWGDKSADRIDQVLASLPEPAKEQAMTYRDYLIKRGIERGIEKGARSARRALLALIQLKFGAPDEELKARVEACDVDRLETLADAVLAADSVEQIFA